MLTGSVVSSIQGEPRLTHDIDIIIHCNNRILKVLHDNFDERQYYFDDDTVKEAISSIGMFNLIEIESGDKIDFWLLSDSAFDESRFQRKIRVTLFGEHAWISSTEDTILAKMLWSKNSGGSEKQFNDALRVYEINADTINLAYIEHWSSQLNVEEYWHRLLQRALLE